LRNSPLTTSESLNCLLIALNYLLTLFNSLHHLCTTFAPLHFCTWVCSTAALQHQCITFAAAPCSPLRHLLCTCNSPPPLLQDPCTTFYLFTTSAPPPLHLNHICTTSSLFISSTFAQRLPCNHLLCSNLCTSLHLLSTQHPGGLGLLLKCLVGLNLVLPKHLGGPGLLLKHPGSLAGSSAKTPSFSLSAADKTPWSRSSA